MGRGGPKYTSGNCIRCRNGAADAADPVVVSLSGCYGDNEAILMWKLRKGDVSQCRFSCMDYGTILVPVTVNKRLSLEQLLYYLRQRLAHVCLFVSRITEKLMDGFSLLIWVIS